MIKAVLYVNSDNNIVGFQVGGHAGYENIGKDIVCAAVSVLTINTVNAIEKFTDCRFKCEQDKSGLIRFKLLPDSEFSSEQGKQGQILLHTLELGLINISKEYGDRYVQVHYKEV
mgnify:FL=1